MFHRSFYLGLLLSGLALGSIRSTALGADAKPLPAEDLRQALALAKLAAKNQMQDLSLRAVRQALANGPALQNLSIQIGTIAPVPQRNQNNATYQQQVNEIEAAVSELSAEWSRQQFEAAAVYETLVAIVFPESRPTEIFLYVRAEDENRSARPAPNANSARTPGSVGALLVEWAIRADRTQALATLVESRAASPRAKFDAWVLVTEMALKQTDWPTVDRKLTELQSPEMKLSQGTQAGQGDAVARIAMAALNHSPLRERAAATLEAAANARLVIANNSNPQLEPQQSWRRTAALARLQMNDVVGARRNFDEMLKASEAYYSRYSGDYPLRMRKQLLETMARDLLQNNHFIEAFRFIGDYSELQNLDASTVSIPTSRIARQLGQLSAAERYEFLKKWAFAGPPGSTVRMITGYLPAVVPPAEFEVLLEPAVRQSGFSFPPSTPHPMIFHSGAALVASAAECGLLPDLAATVKKYVDGKSPNADVLDQILRLRADDVSGVIPDLDARTKNTSQVTTLSVDNFVLGLFASERPETRALGERLMTSVINDAKRLQQRLPESYMAMASVDAFRRAGGNAHPQHDGLTAAWPGLRDWRPIGLANASELASGAAPNWFTSADGVLRAVSAEQTASLMFRYPLTGDFDLHVTVTEGDSSEGAVGYGGYEVMTMPGQRTILMAIPVRNGPASSTTGALLREANVDNDLCWQVRGGQQSLIVNGHRSFANQPVGQATPFLGLRTSAGLTSTFRQVRIEGAPTIPREVLLLSDERLMGWSSRFYQGSVANASSARPTAASSKLGELPADWSLKDGILDGQRRPLPAASNADAATGAVRPTSESVLFYQRPLWDGEQVRYEFFYESSQLMVHPALDRLAFLICPDAVRLHWLTEGAADWTGLSSTNAADDPAGQLAAGKIPLKDRDWNTLVLSIQDAKLLLTLNDKPIYQRAIPPDANRRFGFFHDRETEAVRVRNAVLTGDWPETLPNDQQDLFALAKAPAPGFQQLTAKLISEDIVTKDALALVRRSRKLPVEQRYSVLHSWVLPQGRDVRLRLRGDLVSADDPLTTGPEPHVVSPALDLIAAAIDLKRIKELREEVAALPADGALYDRRARLAMLTLLDLSQNRTADVVEHLKTLSGMLPEVKSTVEWERWPEVLVASQIMWDAELREPAILLLDWIIDQQIQKGQPSGARFDQRVRALRGTARGLAITGAARSPLGITATEEWIPVTHSKADTRALGIPEAQWLKTPQGMRKLFGCEDDFLYFRSPLQGDFEVEAEVSTFGYREMQMMYAGRRIGALSNRTDISVGEFTTTRAPQKLAQPYKVHGGWTPMKLAVKDGRMTVHLGGTLVYDDALPAVSDPWFAFVSGGVTNGEVRRVRITGAPKIPEELSLLALEGLDGWSATFYREIVQPANTSATWTRADAELVGPKHPDLAGSGKESLLRYHRPLAENGALTYRFRYVPGEKHVHPALGDTVFLLNPDGVALHALTNGIYETSGLSTSNSRLLEGTGPLPLKPNDDNDVTLKLEGDDVTIILNGKDIARQPLGARNNRLFGFFHQPGETEARISKVTFRGEWPRQLPQVENQELARVDATFGDDKANTLPLVFTHDFRKDGIPKDRFTIRGDANLVQASPEGLVTKVVGIDGYRETGLTVRHSGTSDLDITADYSIRQVDEIPASLATASAGLSLDLWFSSPLAEVARIGRRVKAGDDQAFEGLHSFTGLDGKKVYAGRDLPALAQEGTFRAVRRGRLVHVFVREKDDPEWRFVETTALGRPDHPLTSFTIIANVLNGKDKRIEVVWKTLTLRAAKP